MKTSHQWFNYFENNLAIKRIDWKQSPAISQQELKPILKSLQAWQLGETSDGSNLIRATTLYAKKIDDPYYIKAMQLFIIEEQKHGNNLGRYLDLIGKPRINKNWGDSLFKKVRHFNTSMEFWTLAVITVESAAQIFYQCLKEATHCNLLKQICTDILIDEAAHIQFQQERMTIIFKSKNVSSRNFAFYFYRFFFRATSLIVWFAHKKLFMAGKHDFKRYYRKMNIKLEKTIGKLKQEIRESYTLQPC